MRTCSNVVVTFVVVFGGGDIDVVGNGVVHGVVGVIVGVVVCSLFGGGIFVLLLLLVRFWLGGDGCGIGDVVFVVNVVVLVLLLVSLFL